jgi:hypothetical protein
VVRPRVRADGLHVDRDEVDAAVVARVLGKGTARKSRSGPGGVRRSCERRSSVKGQGYILDETAGLVADAERLLHGGDDIEGPAQALDRSKWSAKAG